jgi:CBS domain-containing protein
MNGMSPDGDRAEERTTAGGVGFRVRLAESLAWPRLSAQCVMTTVRRILDQKGHQVWFVHPDDTMYDAIKMMADKNVGALVVLDGSKMVGIVTERDYARNLFLKGRESPQTLVSEIMERNVVCVEPDNRSRNAWQS